MRAIYIQQHGPIDDLKVSDVPVPSIKAGEVLVKIEASGINPSDLVSVQGRFTNAVLPRIVGRDFAGRVVDGPTELIGAEVWGSGGDLGIARDGTHAEYVALPAQAISRRPANLSAEQAATVGVPFVTAYSALFRLGNLKEGEWVIVSGAAGSVGQAAIALAHDKGARVVALVKNAAERTGADFSAVQAIAQSDAGDLESVVHQATNGKGAGLALNGVGSSIFKAILGALAIGGRQVVYSAAGGREFTLDILDFYHNELSLFGLDTVKLDATACAVTLTELAPMFESGALKPLPIAARHPLSEAAQAYRRVSAGGIGKVVFEMTAG